MSNKGPSFYTVTNKLNDNKHNNMIDLVPENIDPLNFYNNLAELKLKTKDYYGYAFRTLVLII